MCGHLLTQDGPLLSILDATPATAGGGRCHKFSWQVSAGVGRCHKKLRQVLEPSMLLGQDTETHLDINVFIIRYHTLL